jgi:hypothetical protein
VEISEDDVACLQAIFSIYEEELVRHVLKKSMGNSEEAADLLSDEFRMQTVIDEFKASQ